MSDTPVHTHDGKVCFIEDCVLDRDRPAMLTPEPFNLESQESFATLYGRGILNDTLRVVHDINDRVLPLRFVHNLSSGALTIRCVGTPGRLCREEWQILPYGDERGSQVWSEALGHCATDHPF